MARGREDIVIMIKLVCLFKIKTGMTQADFVEYYENTHVPLLHELMPQIVRMSRNYVLPDGVFLPVHAAGGTTSSVPFDVVTEVWFTDRSAFEEVAAITADPVLGARIAEDEARFIDRSQTTLLLVDEKVSTFDERTTIS